MYAIFRNKSETLLVIMTKLLFGGTLSLITDQVRFATRRLKIKNHYVAMDLSRLVKGYHTFSPLMSVKDMGRDDFQAYNLGKAIAPQKGALLFLSVLKSTFNLFLIQPDAHWMNLEN